MRSIPSSAQLSSARAATAWSRRVAHRWVTLRRRFPPDFARGEAADVVILDEASADELARRGLVRADSKIDLARSLIGMVVRAGAAKPEHRQRRGLPERIACGKVDRVLG